LVRFSLPLDGTAFVLRKRLNTHLQALAAEFGNSKLVQVRPSLEKPTSTCAASENILLCADDAQREIIQVTLHYNGVGIAGIGVRLVTYPPGILNIISMEVLKQRAYFAAVGLDSGLYACDLSSLEVEQLLKNNLDSCREIKRLWEFEDGIAFTDSGDRKMPWTKYHAYVNDNIIKTVSEVKQRHSIMETTETNGPEKTVSHKTRVSLKHLEERMRRLHNSLASIKNDYLQDINMSKLLTTVVENLHSDSHFKHKTFTALQYSKDFGLINNESLKRVTKWAAKYFTHEKSYYPIPQTNMEFANVNFMRPLPSVEIDPEIESAMKEFVEKYLPLRQRTVRKETTKDRAGTLPPAVNTKQQDSTKVDL
ncbi:hypothetical protein AWC38_SpisGene13069, partial [Stylophora pistillata]